MHCKDSCSWMPTQAFLDYISLRFSLLTSVKHCSDFDTVILLAVALSWDACSFINRIKNPCSFAKLQLILLVMTSPVNVSLWVLHVLESSVRLQSWAQRWYFQELAAQCYSLICDYFMLLHCLTNFKYYITKTWLLLLYAPFVILSNISEFGACRINILNTIWNEVFGNCFERTLINPFNGATD